MRLPIILSSDLGAEHHPVYEDMRLGIASNFQGFSSMFETAALYSVPWNRWIHEPKSENRSGSSTKVMGIALVASTTVREVAILVTGLALSVCRRRIHYRPRAPRRFLSSGSF
jgi:4-carboxymuconolactone decarboxylase